MKKQIEISEYDQQAIDFLKATGATIQKVYTGHRPYWADEKEFRTTFMVTIMREGKPAMSFPFGQSMVDSWKFSKSSQRHSNILKPFNGTMLEGIDLFEAFSNVIETGDDKKGGHGAHHNIKGWTVRVQKAEKAPSDYDILAAITKYDPCTFDDFCSEYGYDTDSRKAETTYQAVRKEYTDLSKIFTGEELEQMSEIQ